MLKAHIIKKRRELQVDVELELKPGSAVGLFGASGAGKRVRCWLALLESRSRDDGYVRFSTVSICSRPHCHCIAGLWDT